MSINVPVPGYGYRSTYLNGLALAWASNTTLTVGAGACSDSTNKNDIILPEQVTLSTTAGINGLDAGVIANDTFYRIFLIGSSRGFKPVATIISASNAPAMPDGYDMYRRIGYALTNGSAQFITFYAIGGATRSVYFDAPISIGLSLGNTSYTTLNLNTIFKLPSTVQAIKINYRFVPATAGNSAFLRPASSSSVNNLTLSAPVAGQPSSGYLEMNTDTAQSIAYKTTAGGDALSLYVLGFDDYL